MRSARTCTPSDRPSKRQKPEVTPATDPDVSYDSEDSFQEEENDLLRLLPDDMVGTIFFGGFVNSLEVVKTVSCVSKEMQELAKTQVKMLDLRKCPNLTNLAFIVKRFPHLRELDLGYCEAADNISDLGGLNFLKVLKLRGTSVSDAGISAFLESRAARGLEELDLSAVNPGQSNLITDQTAKLLSKQCPNLKSLKLAWCRGITDAASVHMAKLTDLTELDLQLTSFTANGCKALSKFSSLEKLDLSACRIGEFGLAYLFPSGSISNLKVLELRFNLHLDEKSLKLLLTHTPKLEVLNVQSCNLTRNSARSVFLSLQRRGVTIKVDRYLEGVPDT